jgi:hypothetical protein
LLPADRENRPRQKYRSFFIVRRARWNVQNVKATGKYPVIGAIRASALNAEQTVVVKNVTAKGSLIAACAIGQEK